jgi:hypothetical protein
MTGLHTSSFSPHTDGAGKCFRNYTGCHQVHHELRRLDREAGAREGCWAGELARWHGIQVHVPAVSDRATANPPRLTQEWDNTVEEADSRGEGAANHAVQGDG